MLFRSVAAAAGTGAVAAAAAAASLLPLLLLMFCQACAMLKVVHALALPALGMLWVARRVWPCACTRDARDIMGAFIGF